MNGERWRRGIQSFPWDSNIQRPAKFALVGAIGVLIQLAVLEALTALGLHYLWATAFAVEAAVLHNFMWHQRFTWRDRGGSRSAETGVFCSHRSRSPRRRHRRRSAGRPGAEPGLRPLFWRRRP